MEKLPNELLLHIFHYYVDLRSLFVCSRVCKRWNACLRSDDLKIWKTCFDELKPGFRYSPLIKTLSSYKTKCAAYLCAWSQTDHSKNIKIKDDCLTLHRNPIAQSTDGVRSKNGFKSGQHYFVVIFHGPELGSAALVGVCTKEAPIHSQGYVPLLGQSPYAWAWDLSKKILRHNNQELGSYGEAVNMQKKIGMLLDMDEGTLEFDLEGVYLGIAFSGLPRNTCLYPAISAVYGNTEISLIYYGQPILG